MNDTCLEILCAIGEGGTLDWNTLIQKIEDWDVDVYEVVDRIKSYTDKITIQDLFYETYNLHVRDVKEWIKRIIEEIEDADGVIVDEQPLDEYEVVIYPNHMCTSYDDAYNFWDADTEDELRNMFIDEVLTFLCNEKIVDVDIDDICENKCEDAIESEECKKECEENFDVIEYLKKTYKGV